MKIVINTCFGGFGISNKGVMRYAELKRITLYPHKKSRGLGLTYYYTSPLENGHPKEGTYFDDNSIDRNDPTLVQVVEEMKEESYGNFAELTVIDIPDDVEWQVEEYDGFEHIAEKHRTWGK